MPDTLTLSRLRYFGFHGLLAEEKAHGQWLEVTVRLEFPLAPAGRADDLNLTVDYRAVEAAVRSVMSGPPRGLVEALAEGVAATLLEKFPPVHAVEVEVLKPHPPVDFNFSGLIVKIHRTRSA
jgi:dihydroneopterin aldolase